MLVRVARKRRVVRLDVELEVLVEPVVLQEADHGLRVVVVLVLGRLARLGLDQELVRGADRLLVLDSHVEKSGCTGNDQQSVSNRVMPAVRHVGHAYVRRPIFYGAKSNPAACITEALPLTEVVKFAADVRIEDGLVPLATAPEDVVHAAELVRDLHRLLNLGGSVRNDGRLRVGSAAGVVAVVREEVRGAPQQLDARLLLLLLEVRRNLVEVGVGLLQRRALRGDVGVVKCIVLNAELADELKGGVYTAQGVLDRLGTVIPWAEDSRPAERVRAKAAECVPIAALIVVGQGRVSTRAHTATRKAA